MVICIREYLHTRNPMIERETGLQQVSKHFSKKPGKEETSLSRRKGKTRIPGRTDGRPEHKQFSTEP